jgi:Flp pilus assembly protein TadG
MIATMTIGKQGQSKIAARRRPALRRCTAGAAVVEFALVAPLLLAMLMGVLSYGGYFWMAHSLQQAANDAARATIGGLDQAERRVLARDRAETMLVQSGGIEPDRTVVALTEQGDIVTVEVSYDASQSVFMKLPLVPMPDPLIRRRAAITRAGL